MFLAWFDQPLRRKVCENNPLIYREAKVPPAPADAIRCYSMRVQKQERTRSCVGSLLYTKSLRFLDFAQLGSRVPPH